MRVENFLIELEEDYPGTSERMRYHSRPGKNLMI